MSAPQRANQYKATQVKTATPGQILILLYEAAIQNIKKAIECIEKKDIGGKGIYIGKTHDIVNELTNSLNFEIGGDVARNLERLYNFTTEQLVKANLESSKEILLSVQQNLETLLVGWRGAVEQVQKGNAGGAPAEKK